MRENKGGFTLIECVIAIVLVTIGMAAVFSLLTACVKTEVVSREMGTVNSLTRAKIEELKNSERNVGGSLTSNVTGYFDNPSAKYVRRWQVSADAMGTQTVTVVMIPTAPGNVLPEVKLTTRMN